jgi:hypothetical protein
MTALEKDKLILDIMELVPKIRLTEGDQYGIYARTLDKDQANEICIALNRLIRDFSA